MKRIDDLRNRVVEFNNKLTSGLLIQNIIYENEAYIVEMNSEDQLYDQGINNLGVSIMDYKPYTTRTIAIKEMKGQPTNRVTLRDEGDFEESFYLEVNNTQFEIRASDFKTEDLIRKYGRQILGLTDENIKELIWVYIFPDLLKTAKQMIYG